MLGFIAIAAILGALWFGLDRFGRDLGIFTRIGIGMAAAFVMGLIQDGIFGGVIAALLVGFIATALSLRKGAN